MFKVKRIGGGRKKIKWRERREKESGNLKNVSHLARRISLFKSWPDGLDWSPNPLCVGCSSGRTIQHSPFLIPPLFFFFFFFSFSLRSTKRKSEKFPSGSVCRHSHQRPLVMASANRVFFFFFFFSIIFVWKVFRSTHPSPSQRPPSFDRRPLLYSILPPLFYRGCRRCRRWRRRGNPISSPISNSTI